MINSPFSSGMCFVAAHSSGGGEKTRVCVFGCQRSSWRGRSKTAEGILLRELEAFDEFVDDGGDALLGHSRKGRSGLGLRILENDQQAGAIALVVAGADGAGEL